MCLEPDSSCSLRWVALKTVVHRGQQTSHRLESSSEAPLLSPAFPSSPGLHRTTHVGQHLLAWFGKEARLSHALVNVLVNMSGGGSARGLIIFSTPCVFCNHSEKNERGRADKRGQEAVRGSSESGTLLGAQSLTCRGHHSLCVLACIMWSHPNIL